MEAIFKVKIFAAKKEMGKAAAEKAAELLKKTIREKNKAIFVAATGAKTGKSSKSLVLRPRCIVSSGFYGYPHLYRRGVPAKINSEGFFTSLLDRKQDTTARPDTDYGRLKQRNRGISWRNE